jgi:hypothetical protein
VAGTWSKNPPCSSYVRMYAVRVHADDWRSALTSSSWTFIPSPTARRVLVPATASLVTTNETLGRRSVRRSSRKSFRLARARSSRAYAFQESATFSRSRRGTLSRLTLYTSQDTPAASRRSRIIGWSSMPRPPWPSVVIPPEVPLIR